MGRASPWTSSSGGTATSGRVCAGRTLADVLPDRLEQLVRGLAFSKSMRWGSDGLRFARPIRWLCARARRQHDRGLARQPHRGRELLRPPLDPPGPVEDHQGEGVRRAASRGAASSRTRRARRAAIVQALDAHRRLVAIRAACSTRSCIWSRRRRCWRPSSRSGSWSCPSASSSRRCRRTSGTSRSAAAASPSSPTPGSPTSCGQVTHGCSRAGSRTRRSRSTATSRSGSRAWRPGSARSCS